MKSYTHIRNSLESLKIIMQLEKRISLGKGSEQVCWSIEECQQFRSPNKAVSDLKGYKSRIILQIKHPFLLIRYFIF